MNPTQLARRLGATTLFSHLPQAQLIPLIERSARQQVSAGSWLGESKSGLSDHLVLLSGELEAQRSWKADDGSEQVTRWRVPVAAEGPGFALLSGAGGQIRVRAISDADYLSIDGEELDQMLGWTHVDQHLTWARQLKVFQRLPLANALQAFDRMQPRAVASGQTIVKQGEAADAYFIIESGEAEVWVTDPISDESRCVTVLGAADSFGEEALLVEGNRTATVTMISPGRLMVLGKADFDLLVKPAMVDTVDAQQAQLLVRRGAARLLDCRYPMEYEESRIPGARLVPLESLRRQGVFAIDPEPSYIVYCRSGRRSAAAAFLLRERGIRALSLSGGIRDWPFELEGAAS